MPIHQFNKEEFEKALPVNKKTGSTLWKELGLLYGEYCYFVPVTEYTGIMIRSSIGITKYADSSGENSIRMWLVDPNTLNPVGGKLTKYITRVPGWYTRMLKHLRVLYRLAKRVTPCSCGAMIKIWKSHTNNDKRDWFYLACEHSRAEPEKRCIYKTFQWVANNKGELITNE